MHVGFDVLTAVFMWSTVSPQLRWFICSEDFCVSGKSCESNSV
jgi:hypothetical protein